MLYPSAYRVHPLDLDTEVPGVTPPHRGLITLLPVPPGGLLEAHPHHAGLGEPPRPPHCELETLLPPDGCPSALEVYVVKHLLPGQLLLLLCLVHL